MPNRSRRRLLYGVGTASLLAVAGCLDAPPDSTDGNTSTDSPNASAVRDAPDGTAVLQLAPSFTDPAWSTAPTEDIGYVARYDTRAATESLLNRPGDTPDHVSDFVAATDFDAATILYLQSVGSSTCYDTIEVSSVSVPDEAVVATASAVDTSGSNTACGQAITYPSAVVRVPGDDLPEATRVRFTSGYGTTGTVTATDTAADGDR
jgi:hypothetical protein